jgi:hypothetical protein
MIYFESIAIATLDALGIGYSPAKLPNLLKGFYPDGVGHFVKKDVRKIEYSERKHFEVLYPDRNYIKRSVNGTPAQIFFDHDPIPNPGA